MRKPKLTKELVEQAIALKSDGLCNADIIAALGITDTTFYRWLQEADTPLKRALKEGLKKAESAYKQTLLNTIRNAALAKNANWTAAAWLLERKYPDEFGRPDRRHEERAEDAPQIVLGVTVAPMAVGGASQPLEISAQPVEALEGGVPALGGAVGGGGDD